jgi:hypothetical protein
VGYFYFGVDTDVEARGRRALAFRRNNAATSLTRIKDALDDAGSSSSVAAQGDASFDAADRLALINQFGTYARD